MTTAPTPLKCGLSLSMAPASIGASGGAGSISITTQAECAWSATTTATWITGLTPSSGQGGGHVDFQVTANQVPQGRQAEIQLNGNAVQIRQDAAPCQFDLTPRSQAVPASGGSIPIAIATLAGCAWTATSGNSWLTINPPSTGNRSGNVVVAVQPNTGTARTGSIAFGGQSFAVTQAASTVPPAPVCSSSISPASATVPSSGDVVRVTVHAAAGCAWSTVSHDAWLTVTSGVAGTGDGSVTINVDANADVARIATLEIAGQALVISQADGTPLPCTFALTSSSQSATAAGGVVSTNVTAPLGCRWTAVSNAAWLTVTSAAADIGNGPVTITVAADTGASRTGTVTIAGLTFTVNQAGSCALTLSPTSLSLAATAITGSTVAVTTATGCAWTATSNDAWLTITSGASGSGNGSVVFNTAADTGASRTGTLTIGGQTFTVNQAGSCALSISPTSLSLPATATTGSTVAVTTATGCTWTATTAATWLTITSGASGAGNGSVVFNTAANSGPSRSGSLTIGGQTFTVTQAGGCTASLTPTSKSVAATASTGNTVAVTTASGCTWTATSNDSWLTITAGASGSGNGTTTYSVAANTSVPRTGTLTVAGVTFTVNQSNGCAFTITPTSAPAVAAATTGNTVGITTAPACSWTATSHDGWLTITAGAGGTGVGTTTYSVAANTGPARAGTLTVAGNTFTVNQANGCTYSLSPTSASFGKGAQTGRTIAVTTTTGCAWTATSPATWITITTASGSGSGTVRYDASANGTGVDRTATITIAGISFSVMQGK